MDAQLDPSSIPVSTVLSFLPPSSLRGHAPPPSSQPKKEQPCVVLLPCGLSKSLILSFSSVAALLPISSLSKARKTTFLARVQFQPLRDSEEFRRQLPVHEYYNVILSVQSRVRQITGHLSVVAEEPARLLTSPELMTVSRLCRREGRGKKHCCNAVIVDLGSD